MAYAEERGDCWRGRYKNPPGVTPKWGTVSEDQKGWAFTKKQKALDAANDKEAEMRKLANEWRELRGPDVEGMTFDDWSAALELLRRKANGRRDPNAGDVIFKDWVETKWWPAQDLEGRTVERYETHLRCDIYPHFGERQVATIISQEEVAAWELGLQPRLSAVTAASARSLLSTILGDAKDAGLVDTNAAARRRRRGRKNRRHAGKRRVSGTAWVTPLEALLVAERCAVLSGVDDDFVMWVTCAWCGTRWGELIGLEDAKVRLSALAVDQQVSQEKRGFLVKDPKDESFRNGEDGFFGLVDVPPFLTDLLSWQIQARPPRHCRCPGRRCGGGKFVFLGPQGGHFNRGNYNRRIWRPAVDGAYRAAGKRPAMPVLADMTPGWPGTPVVPAWPYATPGQEWVPPRGHGWTRHDLGAGRELSAGCTACGARVHEPCVSGSGRPTTPHRPRAEAARAGGGVPALASWVPIKRGLTPHGMRHSMKVWMDEDGVPDVLKHDRMGHMMPGIGGTYSHVSQAMRTELKAAFQERWEEALAERARMCPRSAVPVLDRLLAAYWETSGKVISRTSPKRGADLIAMGRN